MQGLKDKIKNIQTQFQAALEAAQSSKKINDVRVNFLGKKGSISALFAELKHLSVDEKREVAPLLNNLKVEAEAKIKEYQEKVLDKAIEAQDTKNKALM